MRVPEHSGASAPSRAAVREHRRIRSASIALNRGLADAVPKATLEEVGQGLGLRRPDGVFEFPFEDAVNVLVDACIHGRLVEGETAVEILLRRSAEGAGPDLSALDRRILAAKARAAHSVFHIEGVVPGVGAHVWDAYDESLFFLMDQTLGSQPHAVGESMSAYLVTYDDWTMTTGAPLHLGSIGRGELRDLIAQVHEDFPDPLEARRAAAYIFSSIGLGLGRTSPAAVPEGRSAPLPPKPPGRNKPCHCGSGIKFKRCCGRPEALAGRP